MTKSIADLKSTPLTDRFAIRGDLVIDGVFQSGAIVIHGDRIEDVVFDPRDGDLPDTSFAADIIAPGLIDLQVNGGFGVEVGADPEAIRHLSRHLPATGVTSFLPTVVTSPAAFYDAVFSAIAQITEVDGAHPLGLHLEGPFLSPARAGAHRPELIEAADDALFGTLAAHSSVQLMTLAPERDGAENRIRALRERGVLISLGHSDATCEQLVAGLDQGATMVTHLFNAMSPFEHRAPGVIGAALVDDRATVGLIADGIHCHPASLQLAVRAKGPTRIALVTDMMAAAGMPPGSYELGGQPVIVDANSARLADGTLAGAVVTMDESIRNLVRWTDATPAQAISMASEVPARLIGLNELGHLAPGTRADVALFNRELQVVGTVLGGRVFS